MSRTALTVAAYAVALGAPALQLAAPWLRKAASGRKQARDLMPIGDIQQLAEDAFTEAAAGAPRIPDPVPAQPSRVPDRATWSCVGFGTFVLALIALSAVVDDVPWSHDQ